MHINVAGAIYFTKYKEMLTGFSLNNKNTLDSVVRRPITCIINRDMSSATIVFQELIPGINFNNYYKSHFPFRCCAGKLIGCGIQRKYQRISRS